MSDLLGRAGAVLDANWIGQSTKPSTRLYPHQWSWDSAFAAIGNSARGLPERGIAEMQTLFGGQWSNGLIPHMIFDTTAADYRPSPSVWGTADLAAAPDDVLTSGMIQPAVHALAIRAVGESLEPSEQRKFYSRCFEPLRAWHDYLWRERSRDGGLVEVWHPWESGMDNSPLWDSALQRLDWSLDEVPAYERVDTAHAPKHVRPTTLDYDRYMWLLGVLRGHGYEPKRPEDLPFRVADVLSTSIAAAADLELAHIADSLGAPSGEFRERAHQRGDSLVEQCWDGDSGTFLNIDRVAGESIAVTAASGLLPLLLPHPAIERQRLIAACQNSLSVPTPMSGKGFVVSTVAPTDPAFEAERYWRGPVWINLCWLIERGLRSQADGRHLADELRSGVLSLVEHSGFREYFNPYTGEGLGARDFSWSASLVAEFVSR